MRTLLVLALSLSFVATAAEAKTVKKSAKTKAEKTVVSSPKPKLSRNLSFSGSAVDGKYHSAGESIAQVESEKSLSMLMGIRKNFRDRIGADMRRLESGEGSNQ
ncbi:MAG: hypothetical protein V4692_16225 [Bdellovibrionota bacterium]